MGRYVSSRESADSLELTRGRYVHRYLSDAATVKRDTAEWTTSPADPGRISLRAFSRPGAEQARGAQGTAGTETLIAYIGRDFVGRTVITIDEDSGLTYRRVAPF